MQTHAVRDVMRRFRTIDRGHQNGGYTPLRIVRGYTGELTR